MIIGISGKAGSGKSTLAQVAAKEFGFNHTSFAALLKLELIDYLRAEDITFDPEVFYKTSREKEQIIIIDTEFIVKNPTIAKFLVFNPIFHQATITYRAAMQWYGDYTRSFNKDYWLQRFMDNTDFSVDVIIDDIRFHNEAALIHALGGILVRINWPTMTKHSKHPTENALDAFPMFDSVIDKDHGLSLDNFIAICREHLRLWTGELDDPRRDSRANARTTVTTISDATRLSLQRHSKIT